MNDQNLSCPNTHLDTKNNSNLGTYLLLELGVIRRVIFSGYSWHFASLSQPRKVSLVFQLSDLSERVKQKS